MVGTIYLLKYFHIYRFLWMHNGGISHFQQIKQILISKLTICTFKLVEGTTDSELAGALFIGFFFLRFIFFLLI